MTEWDFENSELISQYRMYACPDYWHFRFVAPYYNRDGKCFLQLGVFIYNIALELYDTRDTSQLIVYFSVTRAALQDNWLKQHIPINKNSVMILSVCIYISAVVVVFSPVRCWARNIKLKLQLFFAWYCHVVRLSTDDFDTFTGKKWYRK